MSDGRTEQIPNPAADPLRVVLAEVERHVAEAGWNRSPALFALADTVEFLQAEPGMAGQLGVDPEALPEGALTPIEQEGLPDAPLDEILAQISWPESVSGCALVYEALVLPPSAEAARPEGVDETDWATQHPDRREVRMAVGVLRDGRTEGMLRIRPLAGEGDELDPENGDVISASELAPGLAAALRSTLD
ncbi:MAG: hypothetical protein JWN54_898 [Mycobacterium sp.]|jgi:hypothetical protein|nr:hypothetical protein [Mycobacterium sp.]